MSKKIHTRTKRKYLLATHKNHYAFFHNIKKRLRPKTFKTEKAAHAKAKIEGLKENEYVLVKVKKGKKFKIEAKTN